jgi:hypothetical protein
VRIGNSLGHNVESCLACVVHHTARTCLEADNCITGERMGVWFVHSHHNRGRGSAHLANSAPSIVHSSLHHILHPINTLLERQSPGYQRTLCQGLHVPQPVSAFNAALSNDGISLLACISIQCCIVQRWDFPASNHPGFPAVRHFCNCSSSSGRCSGNSLSSACGADPQASTCMIASRPADVWPQSILVLGLLTSQDNCNFSWH